MAANIVPDPSVRFALRFAILCSDWPFYFGNIEMQRIQSCDICFVCTRMM